MNADELFKLIQIKQTELDELKKKLRKLLSNGR
jgi:FKBP-type peptidyl-prolyl cis-trans isomerase (trigger factor)